MLVVFMDRTVVEILDTSLELSPWGSFFLA